MRQVSDIGPGATDLAQKFDAADNQHKPLGLDGNNEPEKNRPVREDHAEGQQKPVNGSPGQEGDVEIAAERGDEMLEVRVRDTGVGLPEGQVGRGLGTQIVRTLIQGELGGTIDWHTLMGSGTEVTIEIPLRYIGRVTT